MHAEPILAPKTTTPDPEDYATYVAYVAGHLVEDPTRLWAEGPANFQY